MQLIDANVVLRYLLADQDELYQHSRKIFEPLQHGDGKALITEGVLVEPTFRTSFSRFRNIALHSALPATSAKPHGIGSNSGQARIFVQ